MLKKMRLLMIAVLCIFVLAGCKCKHQWVEATCDTPKICTKCKETEGTSLGHDWEEATCYTSQTCKTCGMISGLALEHDWQEATCTAAKTCAACGKTEGEPLEHDWQEANFQQPQTCSVCGTVEGEPKVAAFVEAGLKDEVAEVGKEYPLTAASVPFVVTLDSYEIPENDGTFEVKEGYVWKKMTVSITAQQNQEELGQNVPVYTSCIDYYNPEAFFASMKNLQEKDPMVMGFTVNYNGIDYTDCLMVTEKTGLIQQAASEEQEAVWKLVADIVIHIPEGYDGFMLCYGDGARLVEEYENDFMKLFADENTLFLRLN